MSEQPGRYQRSTSGMVGALLATLLVIGAFVAFRSCVRTDLDVKPARVDYLADVKYAQSNGARLVYPDPLPQGWRVTHLDLSSGGDAGLSLSMLTADDQYAGFVQSRQTTAELVTSYVDEHATAGEPVQLGGRFGRWDTWTDSGGDTGWVTRWHGQSLLLFGSASSQDLRELAASLTTKRR